MPVFIPEHQPRQTGHEDCYVPLCNGQLLCAEEGEWEPVNAATWDYLNPEPQAPVHFLGRYKSRNCHVVSLSEPQQLPGYQWQPLRVLMGIMDEARYEVAARAIQLVHWDRDHRYCGRCGEPTCDHSGEMAKHCPRCELLYYPRLSPCVITVVTRGEELLLAHNYNFPSRYFSALAGFIEAGETVESALRREVYEEVGVQVGKLHYFGSQSWPFPGQLMIGFLSEYAGGEIQVDGVEIEEAAWYRYDDLPLIPPAATLSGQLIRHFVAQFAGQPADSPWGQNKSPL